jgi:hypothetical protein
MSSHTPGPWNYGKDIYEPDENGEDEWSGWYYIWPQSEMSRVAPNRDWIAMTAKSFPEQESNARLISAAPELLEALKREHQYHRDALGVACFDCPVCQLIRRCEQ